MKKVLLVMITMVLGSGLMLGVVTPEPVLAAGPVEINLVSFIPKMNPLFRLWEGQFVKVFNERGKGKAKIVYRGGPEVVGPFDLGRAVSHGQIDMGFAASTMYGSSEPRRLNGVDGSAESVTGARRSWDDAW